MMISPVQARNRWNSNRGAAAVELAGLLPILVFCSMASVDFARVAYVQVTLQTCARNGALYEFYNGANLALPSGWTSLSAAANADVPAGMNVSATATSPASNTNNSVTVTVTTTYKPIAMLAIDGLPSIPGTLTLSQSTTMPYAPGAAAVK
jgi:Flp pilus assembly protein TadG